MKIKSIVNKVIAKAKAFISSVKATWKNRKAVIKASIAKWEVRSDSAWFVPVTFVSAFIILSLCDVLVGGIANVILAFVAFIALVVAICAALTFVAWVMALLTDAIKNTQVA